MFVYKYMYLYGEQEEKRWKWNFLNIETICNESSKYKNLEMNM